MQRHELGYWLDRLMGIALPRVDRAQSHLAQLGLRTLPRQLERPRTIDDLVRIVLLAEDMAALRDRGVPGTKLVAKLQDVAQFEATWAEIRCASLIARRADADVGFELESGKGARAHADVRLTMPDGQIHRSIEVKAIGLSGAERRFMQRMSGSLGLVMPPVGLANVHSPIDGTPPKFTTAFLQESHDEAARWASSVPDYPPGLAAATIVLREAEEHYLRRVRAAIAKALRQLPLEDECWIAFYWTNGAPTDQVVQAVDWAEIPDRVLGLAFVGCVFAFPHRNIDCYVVTVPRDWTGGDVDVRSEYSERIARAVFDRTESSGAVRAAAIRAPVGGKQREILRRDGSEGILPFNLVLDQDPHGPQFAGRQPRR